MCQKNKFRCKPFFIIIDIAKSLFTVSCWHENILFVHLYILLLFHIVVFVVKESWNITTRPNLRRKDTSFDINTISDLLAQQLYNNLPKYISIRRNLIYKNRQPSVPTQAMFNNCVMVQ